MYKWFLDPQEPIFEFITQLTGICNQDISDYAVPHEQAAKEIGEIISARNCFVNPITWGGGDSLELKSEFKDRGISFPYFGRRWIDVKTWYSLHMLAMGKKPSGGLSSGLGSFKLQFQGSPHRADVDALNTLRLFFEILHRHNRIYQLVSDARALK
jgi:inhibitor of KinA sporulation pathway (predicted exonuclease)